MKNNLKISYVLPVYNGQAGIANCLRSLINQSEKGEVIVINDASTDATHRIITSFISTHKSARNKIRYVKLDIRGGGAHARNMGNRMAEGDIIAVCDVDEYYKARGKAIRKFFKKFPEKDVFYSALHLKDSKRPDHRGLMEAYEWDFNSKCPISHPTVAYKKEWALKCPYPEETMETDLYEFCLLDMHKKGAVFGGCQNPLMMKTEGNRDRDKGKADEIKKRKYKEYGIDI